MQPKKVSPPGEILPSDETALYDQHELDHAQASQHHPEEHAAGSHGTEMGWLVSYADQMTLLFGLFVLLYVMTMENKGTVDSRMRTISKEVFQGAAADIKTDSQTPDQKIETETKTESVQMVAQLKAEIESLKKIPDQKPVVEKLQQEIAQLKAIPNQQEIVKQLKEENEKLKKQEKKTRAIASTVEKTEKQVPTEQLAEKVAENEKLQQQVQSLQESKAELDKKVQELSSSNSKNFLMLITKWETEKHDIDMVVTDPEGHVFNFKKRKFEGVPGVFTLDSRFGPGLEMWRSDKIIPGVYKIRVSLYNQHGNTEKAPVKVIVATSTGNIELPETALTLKNRETVFSISVEANGNVKVNDK